MNAVRSRTHSTRTAAVWFALTLLVVGDSLIAQTTPAADPAARTMLSDAVAAGKMDSATHERLMRRLTSQLEVRIIVKVDSADEPFARLEARQARTLRTQARRRGAIANLQLRLLNRAGMRTLRSVHRFRNLPFVAMKVDASELQKLADLPEVVSITEDILLFPTLQDSGPHIGADVALARGFSGAGQAVAVLDSGFDTSLPAFVGRIAAEACFSTTGSTGISASLCPNGVNPNGVDSQVGPGAAINCSGVAGCDHGTHVAGIVAADDIAYHGIAPGADLVPIQVFSRINDFFSCGFVSSCLAAFTSDVIRGLEHVYDLRTSMDIAAVNMSLGGGLYATADACDAANPSMKAAIDNLRAAGITTVVASGNGFNTGGLTGPACVSSAVSVGATDLNDTIASFSNSADFLDLLAPGVSIDSSVPGGGSAAKSGTSMAAPHVAGAWAVLRSALPAATPDELLHAMSVTGVPITELRNALTFPRIQIDAALDLLTADGLDYVALAVEPFLNGLDEPVWITHAGDGSGRLFIAQRGGQVLVDNGTTLLGTPLLDISARTGCCGGAGLSGLAFHPNHASNGQLFVEYVDNAGDIVVERYTVSADPDVVDPLSAVEILRIPLPPGGHAGGRLHFGPDGYLYLATGDGALDGAVAATAGDPGSLLGKVLRIDVDGGTPYAIPPDNPFAGVSGTAPEIWAFGLRDPRHFGFDPMTGELFIADVGEIAAHEINIQPATSAGAEDYGWSVMEGGACYAGAPCDPSGFTLPVVEYGFGEGCAVTGGSVYRGAEYEDLYGAYLFGDLCSGTIWGLRANESEWTLAELARTPYEIVTFGVDEAGTMYLADAASGDVYRLIVSDLTIDTSRFSAGIVDFPYSDTATASGGTPPYSWEVVEGTLPAGLTLDSNTGVVSGTPVGPSTDLFTLQVTDTAFASVSRVLRLFVNLLPVSIETTELPRAITDTPFSYTLVADGGQSPLVWSVTAGTLPSGLTLDPDGTISGVPTAAGNFDFTATVIDAQGGSAARAYTLAVDLSLVIGITDPGEYGFGYGGGRHKSGLYATFPGTAGALTLYVAGFDIDGPEGDEVGVYVNGSFLGYLSNGPNNALNSGDAFTIPASMQQPGANELYFEQLVAGWVWGITDLLVTDGALPLEIITTSIPQATYATSYSATLESRGGTAPFAWTISSGALPVGLVLGSDGVISGTPTAQGNFAFTMQISDADGATAEQAYALPVTGTSGTVEVVLDIGVIDSGQYGYNYGSSQHKSDLYATFVGTSGDLTLLVTGYDIDDPNGDEVGVYLNGSFLGYLSNGPDNGYNTGDVFAIPASMQVAGPNLIRFKQKVSGWKWGVTDLLLTDGMSTLSITTESVPAATFATSYGATLEVSGGAAPYTWVVTDGALPAGLVLGTDGSITGIPSVEGSFEFTAQASDAAGASAERTYTLIVEPLGGSGSIVLDIGVIDSGQYGYNYGSSQHKGELVAAFISTGDDLSLQVTGYDIDDPSGDEVAVKLNGSFIGYLSNGPDNGYNAGDVFAIPASMQLAGPNLIQFKQKVPGWKWGVTDLLLTDGALPLSIVTASLPQAIYATSYAASLEATDGSAPYTWSLTSGALPAGLILASDGAISGTPAVQGNFGFTVQVSDAAGAVVEQAFSLSVVGTSGTIEVVLEIGIPDSGQYGYNYGTSQNKSELFATFVSTGDDLALHVTGYDIDDPAGDEVAVYFNGNFLDYLSNSPDNGHNSGDTFAIPASLQVAGPNLIRFKQKVPGWKWGVRDLLLTDGLLPLSIITANVPDATYATSYITTMEGSGGTGPYAWSITSGSLPAGLSLANDGVISGEASVQGSFAFTVELSDAAGDTVERAISLNVVGTSGTVEVVLAVGVLDFGQYGYNYGSSQHKSGLYVTFMGTGVDLALQVMGYDIDDPAGDEVEVHFNGVFIGYLSNGPDNGHNSGDTFAIPAALQQSGANLIYFKQKVPGWKWGVTNLLLTP